MRTSTIQTSTAMWATLVAAGALALAACGPAYPQQQVMAAPTPQAPAPLSMDDSLAMGLWNSNFGAVKIERDISGGDKAVMGAWVYDRSGEEVIGFFSGEMRGNVLEFAWQEPSIPTPLNGNGYIAFQEDGMGFTGRWWSHDRRRGGLFHGNRDQLMLPGGAAAEPATTPSAEPAVAEPEQPTGAASAMPDMALEGTP